MEIHLVEGTFSREDAAALLAEMTAVKIRFHEKKISQAAHAENIKMREQKIRQLQHQLASIKQLIAGGDAVTLYASALIEG